jgi:hypothetical protein
MLDVEQSILHGNNQNKFFVHDLRRLSAGEYEVAGELVAFSLLHGGPGLPVLNQEVYNLMTYQDMGQCPSIEECIIDEESRGRFQAVCILHIHNCMSVTLTIFEIFL